MARKKKIRPIQPDPREIAIALALLIEALTDEEFCHELATDIAAVGNMFNQSLMAISGKEQAQTSEGE